jgi:hypothetical protein
MSTGLLGLSSRLGSAGMLAAWMYRNESIVVRTEIATNPVIDSLKRIMLPLTD